MAFSMPTTPVNTFSVGNQNTRLIRAMQIRAESDSLTTVDIELYCLQGKMLDAVMRFAKKEITEAEMFLTFALASEGTLGQED